MYNLALLYIFGGMGLVGLGLYLYFQIKKEEKLKEILSQPFPDKYKVYLRRIELYRNLPKEDKQKIERGILIFIHTKEFLGVQIEVTDEMKVLIAFHACLLLLHSKIEGCYNQLKTIIIYPNAVAIENIRANGGIYAKERFVINGQSAGDTVIIVWHDAKKEAYHPRHNNVIIHEFAHEIDFMDGFADGVPPIENSKYNEWTQILFKDFQKLSKVFEKNRDIGKYKLLGEYATTNKAEFFAVVTERFFESPNELKKYFPELYKELSDIYGIDPARLIKR